MNERKKERKKEGTKTAIKWEERSKRFLKPAERHKFKTKCMTGGKAFIWLFFVLIGNALYCQWARLSIREKRAFPFPLLLFPTSVLVYLKSGCLFLEGASFFSRRNRIPFLGLHLISIQS